MRLDALLRKVGAQQGGVLLDTNVLLLWLMSCTDSTAIATWKKTEQFTPSHIALVQAILGRTRKLITTPHVLTEVTNLSVGIPQPLRESYWSHLRSFIAAAQERGVDARSAAREPEFSRLGLADIAQVLLRRRGRPLIVTIDADLTACLEQRGLPVVNLNHYAFAVP
jgi:predicted nucleic acid-binding protein